MKRVRLLPEPSPGFNGKFQDVITQYRLCVTGGQTLALSVMKEGFGGIVHQAILPALIGEQVFPFFPKSGPFDDAVFLQHLDHMLTASANKFPQFHQ